MMNETERAEAVERLLNAEKVAKQATLLSESYPHIQIEDSYAISSAVAHRKIKDGAKLIGHKVGEIVEVNVPSGIMKLEILSIK